MIRRILPVVLTLLALTACTGITRPALVTAIERQQLLSGELIFTGDRHDLALPEANVFEMTPAMVAFAEQAAGNARSDERKIHNLLQALMSPDQLGITFDESGTRTAREAFELRKANCLSFTSILVPMLRHLGLDAQFNDVEIPPVWNLEKEEIMVLYRHINAIVTWPDQRNPKVVDINMDEYNSHYPQRMVPDWTAEAHYYSNRSVELLLEGRTEDAFLYLARAIQLDPDVSYFWVNLAAIYRKSGNIKAAEVAIRQALEVDSAYPVAVSSAERIYRDLGDMDRVAYYEKRSTNFRRRNPYYHYYVAMEAFLHKDYEAALGSISQAIQRFPDEHRFHFLKGAIYLSLDRSDLAEKSLSHAVELASNPGQRDRYRRKIDIMM